MHGHLLYLSKCFSPSDVTNQGQIVYCFFKILIYVMLTKTSQIGPTGEQFFAEVVLENMVTEIQQALVTASCN